MDQFKDIRPYRDEEIRPVLERLMGDREFLDSIARFYFPRLTGLLPRLMQRAAASRLGKQLSEVKDVATMQDVIAHYMDKMIHDTTTRLTHEGLEALAQDRHYLFISNHRDIVMDPAFVNYMLYHADRDTLQIAIGDNLLKKPFVTDLMRLNKSFIVRRSLKGRELLQALKHLSSYIHWCIENNQNVWIAQREGRAKDGIDKTDPALLKMLAMANRELPLGESLASLHIVPVAISYEYDACDELKAEELYQIEQTGSLTKTDRTDIQSIVTGIIGQKGQVHVSFGTELNIDSDDPDQIAAAIDRQIVQCYRLQDSNFLALERLIEKGWVPAHFASALGEREIQLPSRQEFERRLRVLASHLERHFLFNYANPIINRCGLQ